MRCRSSPSRMRSMAGRSKLLRYRGGGAMRRGILLRCLPVRTCSPKRPAINVAGTIRARVHKVRRPIISITTAVIPSTCSRAQTSTATTISPTTVLRALRATVAGTELCNVRSSPQQTVQARGEFRFAVHGGGFQPHESDKLRVREQRGGCRILRHRSMYGGPQVCCPVDRWASQRPFPA